MFRTSIPELVRMPHKPPKTPKPLKTPQRQKKSPSWQPTFMREWRDAQGYTLEQMGDWIGVKHSQLSRIERGIAPYSQKILEAYADLCDCTVADLLTRKPNQDAELHQMLAGLNDEQKTYAAAVLAGISRTPSRKQ